MKYMGSKNRISKHILQFTQTGREYAQWYVEPFVGGGNMLDKVVGNCKGFDNNLYVIEALKLIRDNPESLPKNNQEFGEAQYKHIRDNKDIYAMGLVGYVGFALSYGGKWFGGWCRDGAGKRDYVSEAYRNAAKQSPHLQNSFLIYRSYLEIELPKSSIVYCDPPYAGSTKYKDSFDHDEFWEWCRQTSSEGHAVYISEYEAPDDFICIWQKEINSSLTKNTGSKKAIEKLFTLQEVIK